MRDERLVEGDAELVVDAEKVNVWEEGFRHGGEAASKLSGSRLIQIKEEEDTENKPSTVSMIT